MSGRIDTPLAIQAPHSARRNRVEIERARTIWLTEPIDLRVVVERVGSESAVGMRPNGTEVAPEEIARGLRDPRRGLAR